jgi:hypothetical protein
MFVPVTQITCRGPPKVVVWVAVSSQSQTRSRSASESTQISKLSVLELAHEPSDRFSIEFCKTFLRKSCWRRRLLNQRLNLHIGPMFTNDPSPRTLARSTLPLVPTHGGRVWYRRRTSRFRYTPVCCLWRGRSACCLGRNRHGWWFNRFEIDIITKPY